MGQIGIPETSVSKHFLFFSLYFFPTPPPAVIWLSGAVLPQSNAETLDILSPFHVRRTSLILLARVTLHGNLVPPSPFPIKAALLIPGLLVGQLDSWKWDRRVVPKRRFQTPLRRAIRTEEFWKWVICSLLKKNSSQLRLYTLTSLKTTEKFLFQYICILYRFKVRYWYSFTEIL